MLEKNDKSENAPMINDVPEMNELMPEKKCNKKKLKIILVVVLSLIIVGMITAIVLSIVSFKKEKEEKKEEPEPPIEEIILGEIVCKYLLKEDTYSSILNEQFIPPENFTVIIDGKKYEKYENVKLNKTGEYNITYQIKQDNFKMNKMFAEVKNLISVDMISKNNCSLISMEQAFENCKDLTHFSNGYIICIIKIRNFSC